MICNKVKLAEIFGVSEAALTKWQKAGMPIKEKAEKTGMQSKYDTKDCIAWYVQYKGRADHNLSAEKARLTHHQANKTAIEEEALKGKLIDADIVLQAWVDRTLKMRAVLLALPTKLASVALAAKSLIEVRDYCTQEIHRALHELSATDYNDNREMASDAESTASPESERVGGGKPPTKRRSKRGAGAVAQ